MSEDDLIQRRLWGVESAVIDYARDAIASGEPRETTIRRLRALGLCPDEFFDECDRQNVDHTAPPAPAAPPHSPRLEPRDEEGRRDMDRSRRLPGGQSGEP